MSNVDPRWLVAGLAVVLILIGGSVLRTQATAASCPHHSRWAGRLALVVGWASLAGGTGLLGYALFLLRGA